MEVYGLLDILVKTTESKNHMCLYCSPLPMYVH